MKYLMSIFIVLMITGCDIESAIGDASERCEDEIAKIIPIAAPAPLPP